MTMDAKPITNEGLRAFLDCVVNAPGWERSVAPLVRDNINAMAARIVHAERRAKGLNAALAPFAALYEGIHKAAAEGGEPLRHTDSVTVEVAFSHAGELQAGDFSRAKAAYDGDLEDAPYSTHPFTVTIHQHMDGLPVARAINGAIAAIRDRIGRAAVFLERQDLGHRLETGVIANDSRTIVMWRRGRPAFIAVKLRDPMNYAHAVVFTDNAVINELAAMEADRKAGKGAGDAE